MPVIYYGTMVTTIKFKRYIQLLGIMFESIPTNLRLVFKKSLIFQMLPPKMECVAFAHVRRSNFTFSIFFFLFKVF